MGTAMKYLKCFETNILDSRALASWSIFEGNGQSCHGSDYEQENPTRSDGSGRILRRFPRVGSGRIFTSGFRPDSRFKIKREWKSEIRWPTSSIHLSVDHSHPTPHRNAQSKTKKYPENNINRGSTSTPGCQLPGSSSVFILIANIGLRSSMLAKVNIQIFAREGEHFFLLFSL